MQAAPSLKISVVADSEERLNLLLDVVRERGGFLLAQQFISSESNNWGKISDDVDAWIIDIDFDSEESAAVDELLDDIADVPILFCDGHIPEVKSSEYSAWKRRLLQKMTEFSGSISLLNDEDSDEQVKRVWVLAGSLGGPEAVKEFLDALPQDLDVAFIYAQHNQNDFDKVLADVLARDSHYISYVSQHGDVLKKSNVALFPVGRETTVLSNGTVSISDQPWAGMFTPSINFVVGNVARVYGEQSGVIIFSGMGDDGMSSCRIMKQCGGQVWAQDSSSCVCDSMPNAARSTNSVTYSGTPIQMAKRLSYWLMAQQEG